MSQVVGQFIVSELSRAKLRPRELSVPVNASPAHFPGKGSTYNSQSMQLVDKFGNAAGLIKSIPPKAVTRIVKVTWSDVNDIIRVKLPYNMGGVLRFTTTDDTVPSGILKVYDCHDSANGYIAVGAGSTMEIPAGQQELLLGISVLTVKTLVTISYCMEVYLCAITFNAQPSVGDLLMFGDYVNFEFVSGGSPAAGNIPVTIAGTVALTMANLVTAFNTTYVAAIEPAGSVTPFMWARLIGSDCDDLIYMRPGSNWVNAADSGVIFYSVDQGLINSAKISNPVNCQTMYNI